MSTITDYLDALEEEVKERAGVKEFRAKVQGLTDVLLENLGLMETIKESNNFDTIPAGLKTILLRWETSFKDVKAVLLADTEIVDAYNWRP